MRTIKINTELFMEELRVEALLRGVKFVEKSFKTQSDVTNLSQEVIFNCTGYSSKYLFNDKNMTGTMDHLVIFKNPSKLEYTVSANLKDNLHMRLHCSGDQIVLRSETPVENSSE